MKIDNADINDMGAVADVQVKVSVVLGKSKMTLSQLMQLQEGSIVELNKKVGEGVDIYVGDNLAAKGDVVVVDNKLGIVLTDILDIASK